MIRILIFCGYCFWSVWFCPLMQEHSLQLKKLISQAPEDAMLKFWRSVNKRLFESNHVIRADQKSDANQTYQQSVFSPIGAYTQLTSHLLPQFTNESCSKARKRFVRKIQRYYSSGIWEVQSFKKKWKLKILSGTHLGLWCKREYFLSVKLPQSFLKHYDYLNYDRNIPQISIITWFVYFEIHLCKVFNFRSI